MTHLIPFGSKSAPVVVEDTGDRAQMRFWEFFVKNIRNAHAPRLNRAANDDLHPIMGLASTT